jgi:catechol 2,3-dioxygenase-like lactoylglutathione lyase family enzyme
MQLAGINHPTAISAKPRENLAFYTGLLGMRLVKKTVNQDDVSAYHLFYADGKANPGTDLTFFLTFFDFARRRRSQSWLLARSPEPRPAVCITSPSVPRTRRSITPGRSG